MNKKHITNKQTSLFIILVVTISIVFLLFVPKISSSLFPFKRQMVWNNFLKSTIANNKIDVREYWQFREFYSPGSFEVDKDGFSKEKTQPILNNIDNSLEENELDRKFLIFNSPKLISLDSLTKEKDLNKIVNLQKLGIKKVLFKKNNSIIYLDNNNKANIIFLATYDEMVTANGFFEYETADKKITEGKNWLNISTIKLN